LRFSYAESMTDPSFYLPLARAAEAAGYDSMVIPDSICYPEHATSTYPYSPDGNREFLDGKPFIEPFSLIPALGAVTVRLRFVTFVLKLPIRHPVLVAKQVTSTAVLTGNRLLLGVGTSPWREDYDVLSVPWERRGRRMDEAVAVIRGLTSGGYFSYDGDLVKIPRIKLSPVRRPRRGDAAPGSQNGRRLDARRWRPGPASRAAGKAYQASPSGGHKEPAVRGARDLRGCLQPGRDQAP
jgi:alkanesulfonate monooxygenase SsuD/methylene tetrahydromethanopterin reductase-like flavin-dependent oxidoreductase (luciferase family)